MVRAVPREFPVFESIATKRGKEVAFLGINSKDKDRAANGFLAEQWLPFPSYKDPDDKIARELKAGKTPRSRSSSTRTASPSRSTTGPTRATSSSTTTSIATSVPQVRVDPLSGLKTIIAGARADRPNSGFNVAAEPPVDPATDPFLPGHEDQTPPTLYSGRRSLAGARVRQPLPRARPGAETPERDANPDLFTAQPAAGAHEVIVNAPEPVSTLSELSAEQLALAVDTWRERMRVHGDAACRHLIVNEGRVAGASIPHTHAQLYAMDFVPAASPVSASASAPTRCARWAGTCSPTSCRTRCAAASGSSRSTRRPC